MRDTRGRDGDTRGTAYKIKVQLVAESLNSKDTLHGILTLAPSLTRTHDTSLSGNIVPRGTKFFG